MNKRIRTRNTIILAISVVQLAIYGLIFYYAWLNNYHELVYFHRKGNWLLMAVYVVLFLMFSSLYDGFKLGSSKTTDLIFSQVIANLFSLICLYIIASLVNKTFIEISGFLVIALILTVTIILLNVVINKVFTKTVAPLNSVYLYTEGNDEVLNKINKYQKGFFNVTNSINLDKEKFDEDILKSYDCIFICGLDKSCKLKLVNECYELGKSIYVVPTYTDIILQCSSECNLIDTPLLQCNTFGPKLKLVNECYELGKSIYVVPTYTDIILQCSSECNLIDTPLLQCNTFGPTQFEKIVKRCFDIVFSLLLLIVTSPLMLLVAIAIKCEDGGPVLYKQVRLTRHKRQFNIYKFRSMRVDAEKNGVQFAKAHDDRITKVGRFIRACRLDELPQLFNILKGDMSVVGPRPERPEIQNEILKELPEFDYRLKVKAGLTGFAQVYGKYNTKLKDKLLFDLIYIENYSLFLDLKIMFLTFKILFSKDSTEGYDN